MLYPLPAFVGYKHNQVKRSFGFFLILMLNKIWIYGENVVILLLKKVTRNDNPYIQPGT